MKDAFQPFSPRQAGQRALEWQQQLDSTLMVGKRHHIVPHFHLSRFANAADQLAVRDRATGRGSTRSAGDMAVTDFYTFINQAGQPDSSFEILHGVIESAAANVLRRHLDAAAFAHPRALNEEERAPLDAYVAAQLRRGMRPRRMVELLTDYHVKLVSQTRLSTEDIDNVQFVPHQNEHIKVSAAGANRVAANLAERPVRILMLDRPLLIIGDEPVILLFPEPITETPAPIRGLANANGLALPISPSAILLYGQRGDDEALRPREISGDDAAGFADAMNRLQVATAVDWVAAPPSLATAFQKMEWPPPVPILRVSDNGTAVGKNLNEAPHRRPYRYSSPGKG